jgi:hypothetical protein
MPDHGGCILGVLIWVQAEREADEARQTEDRRREEQARAAEEAADDEAEWEAAGKGSGVRAAPQHQAPMYTRVSCLFFAACMLGTRVSSQHAQWCPCMRRSQRACGLTRRQGRERRLREQGTPRVGGRRQEARQRRSCEWPPAQQLARRPRRQRACGRRQQRRRGWRVGLGR